MLSLALSVFSKGLQLIDSTPEYYYENRNRSAELTDYNLYLTDVLLNECFDAWPLKTNI